MVSLSVFHIELIGLTLNVLMIMIHESEQMN
jgi:hypothetical protein